MKLRANFAITLCLFSLGLILMALLTGCATTQGEGPSTSIQQSSDTVKRLVKQLRMESAAQNAPPLPAVITDNRPHYFGYLWDISPVAQPPFPSYTNFVSQWDNLQNGWYYTFYTAAHLGTNAASTVWLVRESGQWGSSDPTAYFGLELPGEASKQFQRAFGSPNPAPMAFGIVTSTLPQGVVQPLPSHMLKVQHKGQPYQHQ